jgi:uncharacterized coiled-coil protein SlyX
METDERISALEARLAEYDQLVARLKAFAALSRTGRMLLKVIGQ